MTSGTRMRRGYSLVVPTSRSSSSGWGMEAFGPPSGTLPEADETALDALARIRNRGSAHAVVEQPVLTQPVNSDRARGARGCHSTNSR